MNNNILICLIVGRPLPKFFTSNCLKHGMSIDTRTLGDYQIRLHKMIIDDESFSLLKLSGIPFIESLNSTGLDFLNILNEGLEYYRKLEADSSI